MFKKNFTCDRFEAIYHEGVRDTCVLGYFKLQPVVRLQIGRTRVVENVELSFNYLCSRLHFYPEWLQLLGTHLWVNSATCCPAGFVFVQAKAMCADDSCG